MSSGSTSFELRCRNKDGMTLVVRVFVKGVNALDQKEGYTEY